MSESTDADDEETFPEGEYEYEFEFSNFDSFKNYLQNQAISAGRQFFCSCGCMIFPVINSLYDLTQLAYPEHVIIREKDADVVNLELYHDYRRLYTCYSLPISIIAYIISGLSVLFIGRKYSVIMANLSYVAILLYMYVQGVVWNQLSFKFMLATAFVTEFSTVPFFMYVAEITSPNFRAFFLAFFYSNEAVVKAGVIGADIGLHRIHRLFITCTVISGFSLLTALYMPETPFWQTLKGDPEKAEETFLWLRADKPDRFEFDQMIASAGNLMRNRRVQIVQNLTSLTFVLCVMFTCSVALCTGYPCRMMLAFLNEFYFPSDQVIGDKESKDISEFLDAPSYMAFHHTLIAPFIFLCLCFVLPRKLLFFISYALGIIIVTVVPLPVKLGFKTLRIKFASYCDFAYHLGVLPLSMTLPVEIYPVALREVGVVIAAIANRAVFVLFFSTEIKIRFNIHEPFAAPTVSFVTYFGSLIGILFIILFMPETKGTTLYKLDELTFSLPFSKSKKSFVTEDEKGSIIEEAESGSTLGAGESFEGQLGKSQPKSPSQSDM